jgi:uncharacterized ferredoxin-like protein
MDRIIRKYPDGTIDFDFYRRNAAALRLRERALLAGVLAKAARAMWCNATGYSRLFLRSRCQPTVASGLLSTEAK